MSTDSGVSTKTDTKTDTPKLWKVLLLNDDYTPMDFVVEILISVFKKSETDAVRIMYAVHRIGVGVAGVYPHEIAETKMLKVEKAARAGGFPLRCVLEVE